MTLAFGIKVMIEVMLSLLVIYGLMHEETIAKYERAFWKALKWTIKEKKEAKRNGIQ